MHVHLEAHSLLEPVIIKHVDTFHDQHVRCLDDLIGIRPHVIGVIVAFSLDAYPVTERRYIRKHLIIVKDIRLVIIDAHALLKRQNGIISVVAVLPDDDGVAVQAVPYLAREGAFSAAARAANTYDDHSILQNTSSILCEKFVFRIIGPYRLCPQTEKPRLSHTAAYRSIFVFSDIR
jgi:hypothetical protein